MAARMATTSTVVGLVSSSLSSPRRTSLNSGFLKSPVTARNPLRIAQASGGKFTCFERDWLRRDLNVIGFGLIGWLAPSSIPAINGKSLSGLFFESIGTELSHFPTGPAVTSQFCFSIFILYAEGRLETASLPFRAGDMDGMLALGFVPMPHFWSNWIQRKD